MIQEGQSCRSHGQGPEGDMNQKKFSGAHVDLPIDATSKGFIWFMGFRTLCLNS